MEHFNRETMKTIGVKISESLKQQIEEYIKREYPKFKTYSEVVREAIKRLLESESIGKV
jgi:Arc/MetJ-type ribon-helix-helix transcriptional regulator